jgi:signal transduction histidine kinase/ligand-binding sensor domain-containing protein
MRYNLLLILFLLSTRLYSEVNRLQPAGLNSFLLQNTVSGICEDDAGYMWANTQFGTYRYDGVSVKAYTKGNKKVEIRSNRFGYIHPIAGNKSYFTYNEVDGFIIRNGHITQLNIPSEETFLTNDNTWIRVKRNRINKALEIFPRAINGTDEIAIFEHDTLISTKRGYFSLQKQEIIAPINPNFHLYRVGQSCLALASEGIYTVSWNGKLRFSLIKPLKGAKKYIPNASGKLWFSIQNQVYLWDNPTQNCTPILQFDKTSFSTISTIWQKNLTLYLGTPTDGIQIKKTFPGKLLTQKSILPADNYIYSYTRNKHNNNYYIVSPNGISLAEENPKKTNMLAEIPSSPSFIFQDSQDHIWWMASAKNLCEYDPHEKKVMAKYPQQEDIVRLIEQKNKHLLTVGRKQISDLNLITNKRTILFQLVGQNHILTAIKTNLGWLIGTEQGLIIKTAQYEKRYLLQETVRSLMALGANRYLIGTYSHGLFILNQGKITPIPLDEKHLLEATVQLNKDADGDIWVVCNRGIFIWKINRLLRGEKADYFLETNTDLPAEELNGGQTPEVYESNQIAIPSSRGLIVFNKQQVLKATSPKQIKLVGVYIDGIQKNQLKAFNVPAKHQNIQFNFDISFVENPNNFQVEYRLLGLENTWHALPINRKLTFARLPASDYILELRRNSHSSPIQISKFTVNTIWYMSPWTWILAGLGIVFLTSIAYYSRIILLKRSQLTLTKEIREKTKEIQQNLARLAESKKALRKEYRHRNKLYSILMHDLTSPLAFLSSFSLTQTKTAGEAKDAFRVIAQTSNDLHNFITEFLFWLGHQKNNLVRSTKTIDVVETIQELVQLYSTIGELKMNKVVFFSNPKSIYFQTDPEILKIILRNLLDNANKFTEKGIIKVSCYQGKQGILQITIEDTGIGLPPYIQELLEQNISLDTFNPSINANHKMGLQISKEFILQLNGSLSVETSPQNGTKFSITLANPIDPKDDTN